MVLPKELEDDYHQEIMEFEEERKMRYVTTAERIGMKKGKLIGEILMAQRILRLPDYSEEELEAKKLDELKSIFEERPYIKAAEPVGREQERLIGEILMAQRILRLSDYSEEELEGKNLDELKSIFKKIEAKLN